MARKPKPPKPKRKKFVDSNDPNYSCPPAEILSGMGADDWDVLIVGDGSGTVWNDPCGWAAVLIDRELGLRKTLVGGMNSGTSYLAELLPYVQALSWYADGPGAARLADKRVKDPRARLKIHIVTDNQTVAGQGQGARRGQGACYWKMFEAFDQAGYCLYWHWKARSKIALNRLCDHLAGEARRGLLAVGPVEVPPPATAYDYNPDPPVHPPKSDI